MKLHPMTKNLTGTKVGLLTPKEIVARNPVRWLCECECGNTTVVRSDHLCQQKIKSCGCLRREFGKRSFPRHGMTDSPTWSSWKGLFERCNNPKSPGYKNYGGRGVSICDRWQVFENFYEDMGDRPEGATLDRIDVNGNYEPGNCRWATMKQQQRNRRNNKKEFFRGELRTISEIAEMTGWNWSTIARRAKRGVPLDSGFRQKAK